MKKLLITLLLICVLPVNAYAAEIHDGLLNVTDAERGVVILEANGEQAYFTATGDIPLTLGEGEYKAKYYSYKGYAHVLYKVERFTVSEDYKWIQPTQETITLDIGLESPYECFEYLTEHVKYDYSFMATVEFDYLPNPLYTLDSGKGVCYDYAATFASMTRSLGYPTKIVKGYTDFGYHAWNEVLVDGEWIFVDCTLGKWGVENNYIKVMES